MYFANGTVCTAGGVGNFAIAGYDSSNNFYLFFLGSDGNTGTLVTANRRSSIESTTASAASRT